MPDKLITIERRVPAGARLAAALRARAEVIFLGYEERRRSRLRSRLASGEEAALFMPHGTVLREGDLLVATDGRLVRVCAIDEPVIDITHGEPLGLLKVAYHLGNRHVPLEIHANSLRLLDDDVLADLARQLGAAVQKRDAPFEPETGAYGGGHRHGHDATFPEDDALAKQSYKRHWPDAELQGALHSPAKAHHHTHDGQDGHGHSHHGHTHEEHTRDGHGHGDEVVGELPTGRDS